MREGFQYIDLTASCRGFQIFFTRPFYPETMDQISAGIRYRLDLSDTKNRQIGVEMQVERQGNEPLDLVMPQLSPGSPTNSLNQPARLNSLSACDGAGQAVELKKTEAGHWRVEAESCGPIIVRYRVKADEFSHVRSYLSDKISYVNGPSALMFVQGRQHEPGLVELRGYPSAEWKTSSTLESVPGHPELFYASSYDDIADSNVLAGKFQQVSARQGGTLLQINQNGTPPWKDLKVNGATPEQSLEDLQQLYATFTKEFGEFPRQRREDAGPLPARLAGQDDKYVVTKHYLHGQGPNAGGYEHYHGHELLLHKAAQAGIERRFDGDGRAHERHIMAHELMHKLLAKFVRHEGIDSADLSHVHCSDGLWLSEGGVEWAAMELQRKSGQMSEAQYIKMLQDQFRGYQAAYAQDPSNARENSLDAHLGNSGFYNKGAVTCALLDLEIKAATGGEKGMFDVLRCMKDEFGGRDHFWSVQDVERLALRTAAGSQRVAAFFQDYLYDHKPFDFDGILAQAGMRWQERGDRFSAGELQLSGGQLLTSDARAEVKCGPGGALAPAAGSLALPAFGVTLAQDNQGALKLSAVSAGGSGAAAGLGAYVGQPARLIEAASTSLKLEVQAPDPFTGELEKREVEVSARPARQAFLEEAPGASPQAVALRQAWLS
ncbi:MAG: hypothetical protein KF760_35015 [Candidatus Eremiobacteraeota bacterium]|nr:hypothetical protein [Candidatus Eremiobacteraeota bacterium]MCW5872694.1 hypothetical protein [Candidatus Eremiobacteraeota bacterium]